MSQVGSFGVNYNRTFDELVVPSLPAKLCDVGSSPVGDFMFVQANGAIGQYAWVVITNAGQASELTTTNAGSNNLGVGVAQVSALNDEYLWVWIGGVGAGGTNSGIKGEVLTAYVAGNNLNTTATAGAADDTSTTRIQNVVGLSNTSGTQNIELYATAHLRVN